jgi:hypothetical protein
MQPELQKDKEAVFICKEFQHRGTEVLSYTEKVKLEINTLCNSVSSYLSVENIFEKGSSGF